MTGVAIHSAPGAFAISSTSPCQPCDPATANRSEPESAAMITPPPSEAPRGMTTGLSRRGPAGNSPLVKSIPSENRTENVM